VRPWHEADIDQARAALGAVTFDRLWREGQAMTVDTVLAEAEFIAHLIMNSPPPGSAEATPAMRNDPGREQARVVDAERLRVEVAS
jgi:hypothetical protein